MLKRILLCLALLCAPLAAADPEPEVSFSTASKIGAIFLPPGLYRVRVQGALLFLTDSNSKKSYTALVKLEKLAKRSSYTAVQGRSVDGVQRVEAIVVEGEEFRGVF
jgi:hypothetical protein